MPKLPTVALIGRPNTGKSTLFNRLVGRRKAIVSDIPGTTRDHIAHRIEAETVDYLLVDTGGMGAGTEDHDLEDDVQQQSLLALEHADLILLTMSSQDELTSSDFEIVDILRKKSKRHVPILLVLTKCDDPAGAEELLPQYYQLGIADEILPISAAHKIGMEELRHCIQEKLTALHFQKQEVSVADMSKIAIIGKPNVGKSSLVNSFMSETQRTKSPLLVSDIPGTTRDSTDTIISYHERDYLFIDTAGIKRRRATDKGIETFAYFRSMKSVEMADVVVLVLDSTQEISRQDKRIAGMAVEEGKGLIILINKIDLLDTEAKKARIREVEIQLPFCRFAPILPCSAETREGLLKLFELIEIVDRNRKLRIPVKELRQWFEDTIYGKPMGELHKSKFITQADDIPPTFVIFVKDPKKVDVSQLRHLDNQLRKLFSFEGVPLRWITKKHGEK